MLVVGTTGSGKSELARLLARSAARHGRLVIIDPAGSATTEIPGAITFHDPYRPTTADGRDWLRAHIVRFVPPDPLDLDVYDQLYKVLWNVRDDNGGAIPTWVWLDEAGIAMPAHGAPKAGRRYIVQGRKRALGHIANHTRPRDLDKYLVSQAAWVVCFYLPDADDRAYVAKNAGIPVAEFERLHAELVATHEGPPGSIPHGFIVRGPGLPPQLCAPLQL